MRFTILVLLLVVLCSCKTWKTYTIQAGKHSSGNVDKPVVNVEGIEFEFRTNNTWYYDEPVSPGWNKIRGFSFGHHQNNSSARLGYQCFDDTLLVVGAYCYVNGVSPQENPAQKGIIDTIQPGMTYRCRIIYESGKFKFFFQDKYWEGPAGEKKDVGYILNPYIGGIFTLDHDWYTEIKDNKY